MLHLLVLVQVLLVELSRGDYTPLGGSRALDKLFYRHAATVDGLLAGLSADGLGAAPGGRGAVCAAPAGASRSAGSTVRLERAWCPPRALSRLARDIHAWQAVVAMGVEVLPIGGAVAPLLVVRARPRPAWLRVAPHRLSAACCRRLPHCRLLLSAESAPTLTTAVCAHALCMRACELLHKNTQRLRASS